MSTEQHRYRKTLLFLYFKRFIIGITDACRRYLCVRGTVGMHQTKGETATGGQKGGAHQKLFKSFTVGPFTMARRRGAFLSLLLEALVTSDDVPLPWRRRLPPGPKKPLLLAWLFEFAKAPPPFCLLSERHYHYLTRKNQCRSTRSRKSWVVKRPQGWGRLSK